MRITIEKNPETGEETLVLKAKIEKQVSKSNKMELLVTSHGNMATEATYEGKVIYANVNIGTFIKPKQ